MILHETKESTVRRVISITFFHTLPGLVVKTNWACDIFSLMTDTKNKHPAKTGKDSKIDATKDLPGTLNSDPGDPCQQPLGYLAHVP